MGLIRGVARTAVVAGTATAVSNRVSRRQQGRWAAQEEEAYYQQQAAAPPAPTIPAQQPPDMTSRVAALKDLAELRSQGILTDAEFEAQKQRILGT